MKTYKKTLALYRDNDDEFGIVYAFTWGGEWGSKYADCYRISEPLEIEFQLLDNPDQFKPDELADAEKALADAQKTVNNLRATNERRNR